MRKLQTRHTIGEYLEIQSECWPYTTEELTKLQNASRLLLSLGFSHDYRMTHHVIHHACYLSTFLMTPESATDHARHDLIWLCNHFGSAISKIKRVLHESVVSVRDVRVYFVGTSSDNQCIGLDTDRCVFDKILTNPRTNRTYRLWFTF